MRLKPAGSTNFKCTRFSQRTTLLLSDNTASTEIIKNAEANCSIKIDRQSSEDKMEKGNSFKFKKSTEKIILHRNKMTQTYVLFRWFLIILFISHLTECCLIHSIFFRIDGILLYTNSH